eukprot:EG_transcript_18066
MSPRSPRGQRPPYAGLSPAFALAVLQRAHFRSLAAPQPPAPVAGKPPALVDAMGSPCPPPPPEAPSLAAGGLVHHTAPTSPVSPATRISRSPISQGWSPFNSPRWFDDSRPIVPVAQHF